MVGVGVRRFRACYKVNIKSNITIANRRSNYQNFRKGQMQIQFLAEADGVGDRPATSGRAFLPADNPKLRNF